VFDRLVKGTFSLADEWRASLAELVEASMQRGFEKLGQR